MAYNRHLPPCIEQICGSLVSIFQNLCSISGSAVAHTGLFTFRVTIFSTELVLTLVLATFYIFHLCSAGDTFIALKLVFALVLWY